MLALFTLFQFFFPIMVAEESRHRPRNVIPRRKPLDWLVVLWFQMTLLSQTRCHMP